MRLEPVYLLAPKEPERARPWSRRQWLATMAAVGVAGLSGGFALGRSSRSRSESAATSNGVGDEGRALLDWAIGLEAASAEDLLRHAPALLMVAEQTRDMALMPTLERLADVLLDARSHERGDAHRLIESLAHALEVFPRSESTTSLRTRLDQRR